jgi:outer membrane immunogenic protein
MYRVVSVSVGLVALTLPAAAADVRVRNTPAPASVFVAPPTNWSGFYLGGHIGWGDSSFGDNGSADGILGGLQAGYNYQINQLVFGVEGEISWTDMGRNAAFGVVNSTDIDFIATLTGRLGTHSATPSFTANSASLSSTGVQMSRSAGQLELSAPATPTQAG